MKDQISLGYEFVLIKFKSYVPIHSFVNGNKNSNYLMYITLKKSNCEIIDSSIYAVASVCIHTKLRKVD